LEVIVKSQIEKLKDPIMKCVDSVASKMAEMVTTCTERMAAFPKLQWYVESRVSDLLRDNPKKCRVQLAQHLDIELMYINTKHPDFDRFARESKIVSHISDEKTVKADEVLARGHLRIDGGELSE
jgi:dynamin 1/3